MKKKLTVIKVGGKVVEEESSLNALLNDFTKLEGCKVLVMEADDQRQKSPLNWALKVKW